MTQGPVATDTITRFAGELYDAELTRRPIEPLTDSCPELSLEDAYRIQQINVERRLSSGEKVAGHKIGCTAKAMQELFGVNEPDYGHIMNTMLHDANTPLDLGEFIDPQIEVEPAFILGQRLMGPDLTIDDVLAATDHISVCFEVIDSRIIDWRIKLQDTVADNGSSSRVVLGSKKSVPDGLALKDLDTILEVDGNVVESGNTSAILGHPANGVVWLANKIAEFGLALEAGDVVLPGTCTRCYRIDGHRQVKGRIEGLGDVSLALEGFPAITKNG